MAIMQFLLAVVVAALCVVDSASANSVPRSVSEGDIINEILRRDVKRGLPKSAAPLMVNLGIYIQSVTDVEVDKGYVEVTGYLSMKWTDPRLRFDHSLPFHDLTNVRLNPEDIWWPDIELYTTVYPGVKIINIRPEVLLDYNGTVVWYPLVSVRSLCGSLGENKTEIQCDLKFGSWSYGAHEMDMAVSEADKILDDYQPSGKWTAVAASAKRKETKYPCCAQPYADVTFTLTLRQREITK